MAKRLHYVTQISTCDLVKHFSLGPPIEQIQELRLVQFYLLTIDYLPQEQYVSLWELFHDWFEFRLEEVDADAVHIV